MDSPGMSDPHLATAAPAAVAGTRPRAGADYITLAKPRVNLLVLVTTAIGFHLAGTGSNDLALLLHTVVGTMLVAFGAAAFNQVLERDTDRLMRRTQSRPLPDGRLGTLEATFFATILSTAGLLELAFGANLLAAAIAFVTLASYALIYTPLKTRTSLATIVGSVPGALPPVIGWAAARGSLSLEAWVLFAIVFFWQMPHVLAISWMYREDYERGGIRVLPVVDPDGRSTANQAINYAAALLPVSLLPTVVGLSGRVYFAGALVLGLGMVVLAVRFARCRSRERARHLFFGSLAYLPILWVLMLADRV
jgi:heme o synthase